MNLEKHYKKRDWVYYLTNFLFYTLVVFVVDTIFGAGPLSKKLIISVVSGLVILGTDFIYNQMSFGIDKAVGEDKRKKEIVK